MTPPISLDFPEILQEFLLLIWATIPPLSTRFSNPPCGSWVIVKLHTTREVLSISGNPPGGNQGMVKIPALTIAACRVVRATEAQVILKLVSPIQGR
jgi:hypothetical protein